MGLTVVWIGGHNGHWEVYKGKEFIASCDDNELIELLETLS